VSTRLVIGMVSFCIAMIGLFTANVFQYMMIGAINRKRPDGDRVSYFGFTFFKNLRIFAEYRRLYPDGHLHVYTVTAGAIAFLGLAGAAVCSRVIG
jgi:hypothetical protein